MTVKIWNRNHPKKIVAIYNEIARTGKHPNEINQEVITAIQNQGKPTDLTENLSPITLLSMITEFFAICLKKRIIHRLEAEIQGTSTTEHVIVTKILVEEAITSQCYTVHLVILDMSKAFDSVDTAILWKDLKTILDPDELPLIKIILNTEIRVWCQIEERDFFRQALRKEMA